MEIADSCSFFSYIERLAYYEADSKGKKGSQEDFKAHETVYSYIYYGFAGDHLSVYQ